MELKNSVNLCQFENYVYFCTPNLRFHAIDRAFAGVVIQK